MKNGDLVVPALAGAVAGGVVGLLAYAVIRVAVDQQVTATIDREVPPILRAELDTKLRSMGLTPEVGTNIARFVGGLDQAGVFNALAQFGTGT